MLITTFTSASHLSMLWAKSVQSMSPSPFLEGPFCIILLPMPQSSHYIHAACPAHLLLDLITWLIFSVEYVSLSSLLYSLFNDPVTLSLLGPNVLLSTLFTNTLNLHTILIFNDQVSHPYKTTGKFIILYIVIFIFLASKLDNKRFCTKW